MLSSILATVVLVFVGWVCSYHPRWWLVALLARLTGTGVHRVYRRQASAEKDLTRARWVGVVTGRGNTLTRDVFTPLWSGTTGRVESVQVLLPDPDAVSGEWLTLRAKELEPIDPGFAPDLLRVQIRANTSYLASVAKSRGRSNFAGSTSPPLPRHRHGPGRLHHLLRPA